MRSGFRLILAQLWQDWSAFCARRSEIWENRSLRALLKAKGLKPASLENAARGVVPCERINSGKPLHVPKRGEK